MQIDNADFASHGRTLCGDLALSAMMRLSGMLRLSGGQFVRYKIRGGVDSPSGQLWLEVNISAVLPLICCRCLESLDLPVQSARRFAVGEAVPGESIGEEIVRDSAMSVEDLIEDELIMAVPIAPMHERNNCPAAQFD